MAGGRFPAVLFRPVRHALSKPPSERISAPSHLGVVRELAQEGLEESLGLVELVCGQRLMQGGQAFLQPACTLGLGVPRPGIAPPQYMDRARLGVCGRGI